MNKVFNLNFFIQTKLHVPNNWKCFRIPAESCMSKSQANVWYRAFKRDQDVIVDLPSSRRPLALRTIQKLIKSWSWCSKILVHLMRYKSQVGSRYRTYLISPFIELWLIFLSWNTSPKVWFRKISILYYCIGSCAGTFVFISMGTTLKSKK